MFKKTRSVLSLILVALLAMNTCLFAASAQDEGASPDFIYGDVTANGKINFFDAAYLFFANIGLAKLSEAKLLAADVNANGQTDWNDRKLLNQYVFKKIAAFPVEETLWPQASTPVETTYDEQGNPQILLMRAFHGTPVEQLQATITGTGIVKIPGTLDYVCDYELGVLQNDAYLDMLAKKFSSWMFKTKIARLRLIDVDDHLTGYEPTLRAVIEIPDELDPEQAEDETLNRFVQLLADVRKWMDSFIIGYLLSGDISSAYESTSIVKVGNASYLCEDYGTYRAFFTKDGALRRVEVPLDDNLVAISVHDVRAQADAAKLQIPKTAIKSDFVTLFEKYGELLDSLTNN